MQRNIVIKGAKVNNLKEIDGYKLSGDLRKYY